MDSEPSGLLNRKNFFRALMGEMVSFYDETKGRKQVPLNRVHELPEAMIRQIKPVFFNQPEWVIKDDMLFHQDKSDKKYYIFRKFTEPERFIIRHFDKNLTLEEISLALSDSCNMQREEAYRQVSGLFFEMVSLFVCHPHEQYDFDQVLGHQPDH